MLKYGQYCPVAKSLEILGDHWTLLIIRDLLTGTRHFNGLERRLPGISRALLTSRLRQSQRAGIIEKEPTGAVRIDGVPSLTRAFPQWLGWSVAMAVRSDKPALHSVSHSLAGPVTVESSVAEQSGIQGQ